jgi:hypothetical protein
MRPWVRSPALQSKKKKLKVVGSVLDEFVCLVVNKNKREKVHGVLGMLP